MSSSRPSSAGSSTPSSQSAACRSTATPAAWAPSPSLPTATGFDGDKIPSAKTYDLQFGYSFPARQKGGRGLAPWLGGTQWTLGCQNLLNKAPAYRTDRFGFYSRYEDPRQRFVSIQIKQTL